MIAKRPVISCAEAKAVDRVVRGQGRRTVTQIGLNWKGASGGKIVRVSGGPERKDGIDGFDADGSPRTVGRLKLRPDVMSQKRSSRERYLAFVRDYKNRRLDDEADTARDPAAAE